MVGNEYRNLAHPEEDYSPIGGLDTSHVTAKNKSFYQCFGFSEDISTWNTSQVTDMYDMFYFAPSFNQPIGDWDVSKVTSMA